MRTGDLWCLLKGDTKISFQQQLKFMKDIANGMVHLAKYSISNYQFNF